MAQLKITRKWQKEVQSLLTSIPAIGILGPRQCGKSTMIRDLLDIDHKLYLDLENPADLLKISSPLDFFRLNQDSLICLDEVQHTPNVFREIKSHIDLTDRNGQFIILGSASPALLKQTAESMAGRIIYIEIRGFLWREIKEFISFENYWLLGSYPRSCLSSNVDFSFQWLSSYIKTFFERDILDLAPGTNQIQVRRLFQMLAHTHGQELNIAKLARSLDLSFATVRNYIDMLVGSYQLLILPAYHKNTGKRLVKSPKLYLSDTGVLHKLLNIHSVNDLYGHPVYGFSFESLVISNILSELPGFDATFYKTSNGAELDLVLSKASKTVAIEIKASSAPKISRGFWSALADVKADEAWIIGFVDQRIPLKENVWISNLSDFLDYYSV